MSSNPLFLSNVAREHAEGDTQPGRAKFSGLETVVSDFGKTPRANYGSCTIRAGFCAEDILLYTKQVLKRKAYSPLPSTSTVSSRR